MLAVLTCSHRGGGGGERWKQINPRAKRACNLASSGVLFTGVSGSVLNSISYELGRSNQISHSAHGDVTVQAFTIPWIPEL